jgi:DNA-directed RNA polymerase omega subunit
MAGIKTTDDKPLTGVANEGTWPGIDSRFRLIIVAGLRAKQLLHGSKPRIEIDKKKHRHTIIALEEVKRGLVPFNRVNSDGSAKLDDGDAELPGSIHNIGHKDHRAIVDF